MDQKPMQGKILDSSACFQSSQDQGRAQDFRQFLADVEKLISEKRQWVLPSSKEKKMMHTMKGVNFP